MWSKSPSRNWNPLQNPGISSAQKTRIYSSRFRWWCCSTCGWSIMPSCLPPIFLPSSPSTRCFFFYSEFRFVWSEYVSSALSILTPQTLAILRTWTPAVQVQGPFHWRVQWSVGCATKACFTWPDLVANAKIALYMLWRSLERTTSTMCK